jgi:putative transposase
MSKPTRSADPHNIKASSRTFFVTTKTSMGKCLLQSERNAYLLIDVLRTNVKAKKFQIHDFVIMPDHIHLLITVGEGVTIERAVQLIKGGFSYRLKKEFGYPQEVWHRGFADEHVNDRETFLAYRDYIAQNPVKAGLVDSPDKFPYTFTHLSHQKAEASNVTAVHA